MPESSKSFVMKTGRKSGSYRAYCTAPELCPVKPGETEPLPHGNKRVRSCPCQYAENREPENPAAFSAAIREIHRNIP